MTAGQSGAERGDVWDHNTAQHDWEFAGNFPEKTVSRVTFYDAHETYIRGHRKGYERGYAAGEAAQAGRFYDFARAVADALGIWQAQGSTAALVTRIRSGLADTAPKIADPEP